MDSPAFETYLKRGGRSAAAVKRCRQCLADFETFLAGRAGSPSADRAGAEQLQAFLEWAESDGRYRPRVYLWGLRYYFQFSDNRALADLAGELRQARIHRRPFRLAGFRGLEPAHVNQLATAGVSDVEQMLAAGATPTGRQALAQRAGLPLATVETVTRLADLARLRGVKGIRARLYLDGGIGSVAELAAWEPDRLHAHLVDYVARSGFDGLAPLPREVAAAVGQARRLPPLVQWDNEPV